MRRTSSFFISALLLSAATVTSAASAQTTAGSQTRQTPTPRLDHRELAADQQVIQALNRLTFGPRPGDAQKVRAMSLNKWIDLQLHPERIDDTPLDQFVARYDVLEADQNDLLKQYASAQMERRMVRRDRADSARISRDVIRPNALGKFHDLLEGVAKSPAMLFYLDNARSMADSTRPRLARSHGCNEDGPDFPWLRLAEGKLARDRIAIP